MIIRTLDFCFSLLFILLFIPIFLILSLLILLSSKGGVFYVQKRVGQNNVDFKLLKFRTMRVGADQKGLLTVGDKDPRVTRIGQFLRKFKLDELPQFINVLKGDMSIVGPRPEVRKYVDKYNDQQRRVLSVKPGITDYASLLYIDENELLAKSSDPEKCYIDEVMPAKINLNFKYIDNKSVKEYFKVIFLTAQSIFLNRA